MPTASDEMLQLLGLELMAPSCVLLRCDLESPNAYCGCVSADISATLATRASCSLQWTLHQSVLDANTD